MKFPFFKPKTEESIEEKESEQKEKKEEKEKEKEFIEKIISKLKPNKYYLFDFDKGRVFVCDIIVKDNTLYLRKKGLIRDKLIPIPQYEYTSLNYFVLTMGKLFIKNLLQDEKTFIDYKFIEFIKRMKITNELLPQMSLSQILLYLALGISIGVIIGFMILLYIPSPLFKP